MSNVNIDDIMQAVFGSNAKRPVQSGRQEFSKASKKHVKELQECIEIMWKASQLMGVQVITDKAMVACQNYHEAYSVHHKIQFDLYTTLSQSQIEALSKYDGDIIKALTFIKKECEKNHNYIEAQQEMKGENDATE